MSDYLTLLHAAVDTGVETPSRFGPTLAIDPATLVFGPQCFPYRPRMSVRLGVAEGVAVLRGDVPPYEYFVNPKHVSMFTELSHYGLRAGDTYDRVLGLLHGDKHTRQARIDYDADVDGLDDHACISSLTFRYLHGRLNGIAQLRSSDLWLGLPHDVVHLQTVLGATAEGLGMEPGLLYVQIAQPHLYVWHTPRVRACALVPIRRIKSGVWGLTYEDLRDMPIEEVHERDLDDLRVDGVHSCGAHCPCQARAPSTICGCTGGHYCTKHHPAGTGG